MEIISVSSISIFVLIVEQILRNSFKKFEKFLNFIPLISALTGGILGLILFFTLPEIIPVTNFIHAIIVGMISGLSATGSNEAINKIKEFVAIKKQSKQLSEKAKKEQEIGNITEEKQQVLENEETKNN